jgi:hypothetical protein
MWAKSKSVSQPLKWSWIYVPVSRDIKIGWKILVVSFIKKLESKCWHASAKAQELVPFFLSIHLASAFLVFCLKKNKQKKNTRGSWPPIKFSLGREEISQLGLNRILVVSKLQLGYMLTSFSFSFIHLTPERKREKLRSPEETDVN